MTATLSACRWDWCTQTFPNQSALRDHVELEHIGQAIPVKRKDVPLLRCVENGAGVPESFLSNVSASVADSSSHANFLPRYIQRGIMTEPTASSEPESQVARSPPIHDLIPPIDEEIPSIKFTKMRGTPSPTPSPLPPSPSTGFLARKMAVPLDSSRRFTPLESPLAHGKHQVTSPEPTQSAHEPRDSNLYPTLSFTVDSNHANSCQNNAAGELHGVDIASLTFPAFNSQWQPESQLPLKDSFEDSSYLPSTIDPSHWYTEDVDRR